MSETVKKRICAGILAHVDAGKTTLAEAMLYASGAIRSPGRVDHGSTVMDSDLLERERGITIFSSSARLRAGGTELTLLDTPGHVDFSSETERTLSVLDTAILVISGTDGVQAHTRTLWRLLELYGVPVFIFVTKMDFARKTKEELLENLRSELSNACADFTGGGTALNESLALCSEQALEEYLSSGAVSDGTAAGLIKARRVFPCLFGSGLKGDGVAELLRALDRFTEEREYPEEFGAKVYKITYDRGERLTHLRVTGGALRVRDAVKESGGEKISRIRIYSGARFSQTDEAAAGEVCAVCGLTGTFAGQGLGCELGARSPTLEPVMTYRIVLPEGADEKTALPKLRLLEDEDPQLRITWNASLREIHVALMGEVQAEILRSLIAERFGMDVKITSGRVMYRETIEGTVEGVGHYEPLRHYAEVHLLLEPLERGSGLKFVSLCSEDDLALNWQRLILTHLAEKQHLGVLTGSPVTDMKISLASGRAHEKHTEGGDFRQATYRAVRQGLMQAKSVLLEPYYTFRIEVPPEQLGRVINDMRLRSGTIEPPEQSESVCVIRGRAPVTELDGYARDLAAFTAGRGRLSLELSGYDICHNAQSVIEAIGYEPERDLENSADSVFCAHGGGYNVRWCDVPEYMHLESCLKKPSPEPAPLSSPPRRASSIDERELEAIMEREFGPIKRPVYSPASRAPERTLNRATVSARTKYYIVDGYNVIFGWESLRDTARDDLSAARDALILAMQDFGAFTKCRVVVVFDAYKVPGGRGAKEETHGVHVAYTKENETTDMYIERLAAEIGRNEQVRVVTSDALIQLSAIRSGVMRMSAAEFEREVADARVEIARIAERTRRERLGTLGENTGLAKKQQP